MGSLRVLVVDDDPLLRRLFARSLQRLEVDAEVTADGASARAAHAASPFTLALIDLDLGAGAEDGHRVARDLRANAPNVRCICISGSVVGPEAAHDGFDGFDAKPATVDQMRALLERWS